VRPESPEGPEFGLPGWPTGPVRLILVWGDGVLPTAILLADSGRA